MQRSLLKILFLFLIIIFSFVACDMAEEEPYSLRVTIENIIQDQHVNSFELVVEDSNEVYRVDNFKEEDVENRELEYEFSELKGSAVLSLLIENEEIDGGYAEVESKNVNKEKTDVVIGLDYSPEGNGKGATVSEVWVFEHDSRVHAVAADDEGYVYTGGRGRRVRQIDAEGNLVWELGGYSHSINDLTVDDDNYIYSAGRDQIVNKIDNEGEEDWRLNWQLQDEEILGVDVDSEGYIYIGCGGDEVKKIDVNAFAFESFLWEFDGHSGDVNSVAVDNEGNVYSASQDDTVRKINSEGEEVWVFKGHERTVNAVVVDDNEGYIYSGSFDNTLRKLDRTGEEVWEFDVGSGIHSLETDDKGYIYCGSGDNTIRKIAPEGYLVWEFDEPESNVESIAVDNEGFVYSADYNRIRKISQE